MTDVTRILSAIEQGDPSAAEQLLPLVYDELRKLAAEKMAQEAPGQTLPATALFHEAYIRLVGGGPEGNWDSRGHFFAAAAEAMRRILVDNARRKRREKHGGDRHPSIAKVLDAGATDSGRPYFVMELVRGISITDYCDQENLTLRERLKLFIPVCHAVQHAHQKGIIHRDVKPSNILITLHDGKPVPKVIDFGVAKAMDRQLTERTIYKRSAQIVGTPLYMSPEQAEMGGLDVDTRTDGAITRSPSAVRTIGPSAASFPSSVLPVAGIQVVLPEYTGARDPGRRQGAFRASTGNFLQTQENGVRRAVRTS